MKFSGKILLQSSFILYTIGIIIYSLYRLILIEDNYPHYMIESYNSDWLINYEGGFVRRGIIGQVMLWVYKFIPYDVAMASVIITYMGTYLLTALMFYLFYKIRLSWMLLPTAFLIGGFMLCDARFYRKDSLMLLMIFLTIYLYRKHITTTTRHTITRLLLYIIGTITILTHEASFFCFVPFFLLHYCTSCKGATFTRLAKSTLFNLPFIITMALVCIFKGNMDVCQGIWHSWQPYFLTQYDTMPALGDGVRALSWNTTDTFIMHAKANFFNSVIWDRSMPLSISPAIPNVLVWVIIWAGVYYLCVNVNKIKMFAYETGEYDNHIKRVLPQLLLIQFIALLPMFTILSCDMRRVIFYWIFSTFFILSQLIPLRQQLSIPIITHIGNYLHNFFTNKRLFRSKLFYIVTLLVIGIPFGAITATSYIDSTIIFRINYLIRYFLPSIIGG